MDPVELTIVMPCLNEAETLVACLKKARLGIERAGVNGEVLVADNGSTDGSQKLAEENGGRVVPVPEKGYGSALRGGIAAAKGHYIIMGDADDSYDFSEVAPLVAKLREGNELVMGCRLPKGGGRIMPGAMPWKNRWLGNPVLSFIGQLFFQTPIHDFHCGMRGFTKAAYEKMELKTTGMEFASEMVMKASMRQMRIAEVPITLHKDGRSRPPHLRPWRDGWRHLRFMLIYSPRWLFLIPGVLLALLGAAATAGCILAPAGTSVQEAQLLRGLIPSCAALIVGVQLVAFGFFTKVFGVSEGLLAQDDRFTRIFQRFTLERGLIGGVLLSLAGLAVLLASALRTPDYALDGLRGEVAGTTLFVVGIQIIFSSFFMSVLGLKTVNRRPPDPVALPPEEA